MCGEVSVHFQVSHAVRLYLEILVLADIYCYELFSLFWCGELTSEISPSILGISSIILTVDRLVKQHVILAFVRIEYLCLWCSVSACDKEYRNYRFKTEAFKIHLSLQHIVCLTTGP